MPHPLQCLLSCKQSNDKQFLLAASGSYIYVLDALSGVRLCKWPSVEEHVISLQFSDDTVSRNVPAKRAVNEDESPPAKRPKLLSERSESSSAEILTERPEPVQAPNPPFVKLAASEDGNYVIAVTGEDKCVRVLTLSSDGALQLFSERFMPKRPCAVALTPDQSTILCADKFGDVYAVPLLGQSYEVQALTETKVQGAPLESFVPSASPLTVHTKRNLDSLRQQQNMAKKKIQKRLVAFDHQIVLGHVSLLTDLACLSMPSATCHARSYIFTSDRDEHIRISRGLPQAHVIEGYCLGHTQFISTLCLIPPKNRLLLSGGGDDYLILWDWPSGQMHQRIDIRTHVEPLKSAGLGSALPGKNDTLNGTDGQIAVSGIKFLENYGGNPSGSAGEVFVTVEGVPAIFHFCLVEADRLEHWKTHITEDNVISMVPRPEAAALVFSVDTVHLPFSTTVMSDEPHQRSQSHTGVVWSAFSSTPLQNSLDIMQRLTSSLDICALEQTVVEQKNVAKGKSLQELLYGLESLRKRGSEGTNDI